MILAVSLTIAACDGSSGPDPAPSGTRSPPITSVTSYVSLGDSFSAGPGIEPVDTSSSGCLRSDRSWPSLLAKRLRAKTFVNVSCSGAPSSHLTAPFTPAGGTKTKPQLDAVHDDTQLITLTMGGNDGGALPAIMIACRNALSEKRDVCAPFVRDQLAPILDEVEIGVARGLSDIRHRAPDATVLLVGYPRIAPDTGACKALGISGPRTRLQQRAEEALDGVLRSAARDAGVGYLSLRAASRGHDACAGRDAWVNGLEAPNGDGVALHPNAAGVRAIEAAVAKRLKQG